MIGSKNDQEIFEIARKIKTPEARHACLLQTCGEDMALLHRVEALLQAHDDNTSFLEGLAPGFSMMLDLKPSPEELIGTQIDSYKLIQQIGEGGMGVVFMAEQKYPVQRTVALKVIKPGMDSRQVIARFEAERQALAMMDHVNIARVIDAGATRAGRPYFVMELVHGIPITRYCDDNQLTPRQRLELFIPVCHAIQHAHQKVIIHRDIKPSNVMVTLYDGKPVPKVIDFGVAKATEQSAAGRTLFTLYGTMIGTLEYMSPEQAEMSSLGVDTRSDLYSLGVLLYELLTGSTPLDGQKFRDAAYGEIVRMIKDEEPRKPSTRVSESGQILASISAQRQMAPAKLSKLMRGELDWIVMKTLEKDRNRRYQTVGGLAADIQCYLNDEAVQACPPSTRYRIAKFVRKHRGPAIATAMLVVVLLAGITGTTIGLFRAEWSRRDAVSARNSEQQHRQIAEELAGSEHVAKDLATIAQSNAEAAALEARTLARELKKKLYVSLVGRAQNDCLNGRVADALRRLQECPIELRKWEWNFLQKLCHLDLWTDVGDGKCIWSVAISPDGSLVASGSGRYLWALQPGEGTFAVRNTIDGQVIFKEEGLKGGVQGVAFNPTGKQVACCSGYWSPDGARKEAELIVWDLVTQKRIWTRVLSGTEFLCVAYSPDGKKLAVGSGAYNSVVDHDSISSAIIHDATTGALLRTLKSSSGSVHAMAFSPDAQRIALGESERVELYNVADGTLVRHFGGHQSYVYAVAFSSDGARLATSEYAPPARIWDVESGKVITHLQDGGAPRGLSFDPKSQRIALATGMGRTVQICDSTTGATLSTLRGHLSETQCVAFHPNGSRLVSGSLDGAIKMWLAQPQPLVLRHELRTAEHPWISSVAGECKGTCVVTASRDNTVQVWDGEKGVLVWKWEGPIVPDANWADVFWSVVITPDGGEVFAGHGRGLILRWDVKSGKPLASLNVPGGLVQSLAVSPDGRWLASAGFDRLIRIWSLPSGSLIRSIPSGQGEDSISCLKFSPDSTRLASGSGHLSFLESPGSIALWDVETGNPLWSVAPTPVSIRDIAFSPDETKLAVALHDGRIRLHDPSTGREVTSFVAHTGSATAAEFTPDSRRLISGGTDGIKVWDPDDWSEVFVYTEESVLTLALCDDGRKLIFGGYYPKATVLDCGKVELQR
jgi:WD40 repeat protein/serine/threonine protein kinase